MTQLELAVECRVPAKGTQHYTLLSALQRGERLTVAKALSQYHVYALSQRMGDLRTDYGWPIKSQFIDTVGGARIKEYWL